MILKSEKEIFDSVWERVSGSPVPQRADSRSEAEAFIRGELADAAKYAYMARMSGNTPVSRTLRRLSADEAAHARKLRTAYYLAYGESPAIRRGGSERPADLLGALRRAYWSETEAEKRYREAAERIGTELYLELAADEAAHASELSRLISILLGGQPS